MKDGLWLKLKYKNKIKMTEKHIKELSWGGVEQDKITATIENGKFKNWCISNGYNSHIVSNIEDLKLIHKTITDILNIVK